MEDLLYFLSSFSFDDFITYAFPDIPMDLDLSISSYPAFPFSNMPYVMCSIVKVFLGSVETRWAILTKRPMSFWA